MAPIVASLLAQGLSLLGNAVLSKGQDVVEQKLGIKLDGLKPEQMRRLEVEHEEWLVEAGIRQREQELQFAQAQEAGISARWSADMLSDSWLSKNIRPVTLVYLLSAYTLLSVGSGFGFNVAQAYVELLGQWSMLVMTAYFGGRTLEKIVDMRERGK